MIHEIKKASDFNFSAVKNGDVLKFKKGVEHGVISISGKKELTIGEFGEGENPVFGSFVKAEKWVDIGGGLKAYKNNNLDSHLNILNFNKKPKGKGRFPKTGYLPIVSDSQSDNYLDTINIGKIASGEVVIRLTAFVTNTYEVSGHRGNRITYKESTGQYPPKSGFGYFLQNQKDFLTELGDWMYDKKTKSIIMFFGDNNPNDFVIEVPEKSHSIEFDNCENINFSDLNVIGSNGSGIMITNSKKINGWNINVSHSGDMGVKFSGYNNSDCTLNNVKSTHSNAGGIYSSFINKRIKTTFCQVSDIGMIEGAANFMNGDGRGNGICLEGSETLIQNCKSERTALNGFVFNNSGTKVDRNYASEFGAKKQDCAGFYTGGGADKRVITKRIQFTNNIATNGIGNWEGSTDQVSTAHGFYFDEQSNGVDGSGNCAFNINATGLYIHNSYDCIFTSNMLFGNRVQLNLVLDNDVRMDGNIIRGNTLVNTDVNQTLIYSTYQSKGAAIYQDNTYIVPNASKAPFAIKDVPNEDFYYSFQHHFNNWKKLTGDKGSTIDFYEKINIDSKILTFENSTPITYSNSGSKKRGDYYYIGKVEGNQDYLIEMELDGDIDSRSFTIESNFNLSKSAGSAVKLFKASKNDYSFIIHSYVNRDREQLMVLHEAINSSITIKNLKISKVDYSISDSKLNLEIDKEDISWDFWIGDQIVPDFEYRLPIAPEGYEYVIKLIRSN